MTNQPLLTAIVLNYRTGRDAWMCVEALLQQTIVNRMEIIVIDNHSDDDSIGYLRNRARNVPQVRIMETADNLGYGQGNNRAAAQAKGEFLLIINPDNRMEPRGCELLINVLRANPAIGIVAPQLVHDDGTVRDSFRAFPSISDLLIKRTFLRNFFRKRMDAYLHHGTEEDTMRDVDWVAGACFIMETAFFQSLGGFDPRFFLFFEDTDLCRRVHGAGRRVVYYPGVQAYDSKRRLSEGGFVALLRKKTARIHVLSAAKYFLKWRY